MRITVEPTRGNMYAIYRLVAKVYPPLRWARPLAWISLLALAAVTVALVTHGGVPIYLVPLAAIALVYGVTYASERGWAGRAG